MSARPLDHYCGVCRYALERETWNDGTPERFVHPLAVIELIEPHDPQPIPLVEMIEPNMVCDFCSRPAPTWLLRFPNVQMTTTPPGHSRTDDLGVWWASCGQCRIAARSADVLTLAGRYASNHGVSSDSVLVTVGPVWVPLLSRGVLQEVRR
jgi:hypothetical protein